MRIPRDLFFVLGGVLLLTLDARAVQQAQTAPQTGSATGAATMATPVTTLPNAGGAGMAPADAQETVPADGQEDKAMLPEDANDDQTMLPEDATDTPPATDEAGTAPAPASPAPPTAAPPAPANTATAARLNGEGCWARLYDAENFIGHNVTLAGPAEMPNMEGTFRSIEVGPSATVVTFSEENFADETGRFAAGARVANMREPGVSDAFESLRLTCAQAVAR